MSSGNNIELREKIARVMHDYGTERGIGESEALDIADNILALPEIADALRFVEGLPSFSPPK